LAGAEPIGMRVQAPHWPRNPIDVDFRREGERTGLLRFYEDQLRIVPASVGWSEGVTVVGCEVVLMLAGGGRAEADLDFAWDGVGERWLLLGGKIEREGATSDQDRAGRLGWPLISRACVLSPGAELSPIPQANQ
jgi:hypothetical protein